MLTSSRSLLVNFHTLSLALIDVCEGSLSFRVLDTPGLCSGAPAIAVILVRVLAADTLIILSIVLIRLGIGDVEAVKAKGAPDIGVGIGGAHIRLDGDLDVELAIDWIGDSNALRGIHKSHPSPYPI